MRRNILTLSLVLIVLGLLVTLNLVFVSGQQEEENEFTGDRSSYKGTPYGTLAYYTLLSETDVRVSRFERPWTDLEDSDVNTLVVVTPKQDYNPTKEEFEAVAAWIAEGGHLIVVDRYINANFGDLNVFTGEQVGVEGPVEPSAPTALTRGVTRLHVTRYATGVQTTESTGVVHFRTAAGALVMDQQYGSGHITFVTEPYVLQNNGIREGDNVALALNLVDGVVPGGAVAFDEYHQGRGAGTAVAVGLRGYVAGTPIPWLVGQMALIALVAGYTYGRRFGRPIPLARERRTSALEFVSSMAAIQRIAKASDLAVANIYGQFRTRLCQYAGLPTDSRNPEIATGVARRGQIDRDKLLALMNRCDLVLRGNDPAPSDLVDLVGDIRRIGLQLKL